MTPQATGTTHPDPDHEALAMDDFTPRIPNDDTVTLISDSEISDEPTPSHTRTGEDRTNFRATWPFVLHFAIVLTLIGILPTYIDGHHFNLEFRTTLSGFSPLQSDITTAISAGVTIYRFSAAIWSGAMLWRCIFILLGDSGISLEKIDSLLTWQIHIPPRLLSLQALVSIILLAAFPMQLSGPILTGSITWLSSHRLVAVQDCVTGIGGFPEQSQRTASVSLDNTLTSGFASTAWLNSLEDERTMKRVIDRTAHLPINSTLNNVTLPYFEICKLEWIRNPITEIPQTVALLRNGSWNPFKESSTGLFALVPGGAVQVGSAPSVISETQIIVGIFSDGGPPEPPTGYATHAPHVRAPPPGPCNSSSLFGDRPANIGFTSWNKSCLIFGRVTYVAGAAECRNCRISSRVTVQNDTALTVSPSAQTLVAINMMPMVGNMMVLQNNSLPQPYNNLNRYVTELLIRSYAASWTHISKSPNMLSLTTGIQIAIPTSRAKVLWWRVWVWLSVNLLFTLSGLLFLVVQRSSGQKLVGSPQLAAFLLDTSEVLHKRDRAFCNFSKLANDDKGIGNLRLIRNWEQGGHRQVEFVKE